MRAVVWLVYLEHPELPSFLRQLRETLNKQSGDTRIEMAFGFEDQVAPYPVLSTALTWKINDGSFQQLGAHPAVSGVQIETRKLELKPDRR